MERERDRERVSGSMGMQKQQLQISLTKPVVCLKMAAVLNSVCIMQLRNPFLLIGQFRAFKTFVREPPNIPKEL